MRRLLTVLLIGALFVGVLDTVALAASKTKYGERESAWTTTGTGTGDDEDCTKEDEVDGNLSLWSVCFFHEAKVVYRFAVPRRARLRDFSISYDEGDSLDCVVVDSWARKTAPRRVTVFFIHGPGPLFGNQYACNIHSVTIRYRVPTG